eukprot:363579-Chlamydomonas_euryale.AAC.4
MWRELLVRLRPQSGACEEYDAQCPVGASLPWPDGRGMWLDDHSPVSRKSHQPVSRKSHKSHKSAPPPWCRRCAWTADCRAAAGHYLPANVLPAYLSPPFSTPDRPVQLAAVLPPPRVDRSPSGCPWRRQWCSGAPSLRHAFRPTSLKSEMGLAFGSSPTPYRTVDR